jgi:hypothetical protein
MESKFGPLLPFCPSQWDDAAWRLLPEVSTMLLGCPASRTMSQVSSYSLLLVQPQVSCNNTRKWTETRKLGSNWKYIYYFLFKICDFSLLRSLMICILCSGPVESPQHHQPSADTWHHSPSADLGLKHICFSSHIFGKSTYKPLLHSVLQLPPPLYFQNIPTSWHDWKILLSWLNQQTKLYLFSLFLSILLSGNMK